MSYAATESLHARGPVLGPRVWRSLGARFALWYVAVTLAAFATLAAVIALRADSRVVRDGERTAERTLEEYRRAWDERGPAGVRELVERDAHAHASVAVRVSERTVEVMALASDAASDAAAVRMPREAGRSGPSAWPQREWQLAVTRVSDDRELAVVVRNHAARRLWNDLGSDAGLIAAVAVACAVIGAFVISQRALAPLDDVARVADAIVETGDLTRRVPERGTADELDRLAALLNRMLHKNERLVRAMRESLDNVAHDLRTPLTRLRAGAELALRSSEGEAPLREALADTVEESDRVLGMLTTLMDIAEAEAGAMRLELRKADVALVAREAVGLYDLVSEERGVRIVTRLPPGVEAVIDRRRMLQAFANLLDNAIKYTPPGGSVEVVVEERGNEALVIVRDSGIGIPPEDRDRVWDRLFRGDRSRTERGLGLGLSLVRAVVEAHGGRVDLDSEVGKGSTFVLRLPRTR